MGNVPVYTLIIDNEFINYQLIDLHPLSIEFLIKEDGTYIVNTNQFTNWLHGMKKRMMAS